MKIALYRSDQTPSWTPWLVFGGVVILAGLLKFGFHELWKDEWQAWLMARDMSWAELLGSLYYEGHPALWYLYLKAWALLSNGGSGDAILLSVAHFIPLVVVYYLIAIRFRLAWWLSLAILLSYYPLFEYGVVNRGYVFVLLISSWAVLLWEKEEPPFLPYALAIFLLCQTEVYGVFIAGALGIYGLVRSGSFATFFRQNARPYLAGLIPGLAVFVLTVYPRASQDELSNAYLGDPLSWEAIQLAWQGTLANTYTLGFIPDTNVFGVSTWGMILSALVLAGLTLFWWQNARLRWTFLAFQLVYLLFSAVIYTGGVRQWGVAFFMQVLLLQLWTYEKPTISWSRLGILAVVLLAQLYYSTLAVSKEFQYPFSQAAAAGAFIEEKVPADVPIVAINKFENAPVVGYAGRAFYALPDGEPFTYFKWVEKVYLPSEAELRLFARYKQKSGLVIISPQKLDASRYPTAQLWQSFEGYSIKNERYYLYALEAK
ncbi:MAG: hypothetical protein AAFU60_11570 [Bacteroidota bacterium]